MAARACYTLILFAGLLGCESSMSDPPDGPGPEAGAVGVYVLNEGMFGDPTGARLTFHDLEKDTTYRDIFENANGGASLGSLGDDIKFLGGNLYVVMSGSENLAVLDTSDHVLVQNSLFPGSAPHDLVIDSLRGRIYITRLFAGSVIIADIATLNEVGSVTVGANPQGMLLVNDRLFVCNTGFGADQTVSVVDVVSSSVIATLTLSDGPFAAVLGTDGNVWVSCTGNSFGAPPTFGALYAINPVSLTLVDSVLFTENLFGGISAGNSGEIYVLGVTGGSFSGGPVHRYTPASGALEMSFIAGTFYAIAVDMSSGRLYLSDVNDFASDGEVLIHGPDGVFIKSFFAQSVPGAFVFKR